MKSNFVKTPAVYQMEAAECGAASLAIIFSYYGKSMALERMRVETGVSRDGCSAGNIMRAAKKHGLECHGYRKELKGLLELKPPCIIHWNFNHFVVYEGIKRGYVYLNDPAVGRRRITIEELDKGFTGVVLTFAPTDKFIKEKTENSFYRQIRGRLSGQFPTVSKLICFGLLLVIPGIMIPILLRIFLDDIFAGANIGWFPCFAVVMLSVIILNGVLAFYGNVILQRLRNKMILVSAHKFLFHLFRLPIEFFDQRYAGDLSNRVDGNNNIGDFLAGELASGALGIITAVFYLILMTAYNPALAAICVINAAVGAVAVRIGTGAISDITIKLQQDRGKTAGVVYAGINIIDTLKASGFENEYAGRILGSYAENIAIEQKLNRLQVLMNIIPAVTESVSAVLVLMAGGLFVMRGDMTAGMLAAFGLLFVSFVGPINSMVGFVNKIQMLKADMSRAEDIMNYPTDKKFDDSGKIPMQTKLSGDVELRDVSFGYSGLAAPLIDDFSFKVNSGGSIAIVGASGCGKSTVAKLIGGLYQPWDGEILMDGVPLNKLPKSVICASVSTVSQDITLFSGTIRDNLTMWNTGILEADMIRAAKDACIHDIITARPGAYDSVLAEGASNFSSGQRQRLEIARALTTNPSILIMDEATSALDPIVEKKILDNIKRRGCTCVVIAHRLSAIRGCDRIIVMRHGKIVQRGTHDELAGSEGEYRALIKNI